VSGINRQPRGLLSFLGIKNSGRNPRSLADVLAPTVDLRDWYLAQNSESVTVNISVAGIGFTPFFVVPETDTWAILATSINSQAVLGAGVSLQIGAGWTRNPNAQIFAPLTTVGNTYTVGQVAAAWSPAGSLVMVPPGAQVGAYCTVIVAGPVTCTLNLVRVSMQL